MLTLTTCPTCHHKFTTPEADMGKRHTCPNCQSLFVAGKSVSETDGRGNYQPLNRLNMDKTMLGEAETPIHYNCPRCKKPLEAPASEAGTKKPCPNCGGRLQVPAAPAPAAPASGMNKTLLGESTDQPVASAAVQPAAPAAAAAAPAASAAPPPSAPEPAKAAPSPARTYAIRGGIAAAVVLAILYAIGWNSANEKYLNAQKEYDKHMNDQKNELEKLKAEVQQKQAMLEQQKKFEAEQRRQWEALLAKQEARQRELDLERALNQKNLALLNDQKLAADAKAKLDQKQRELEDKKRAEAEQRARADKEIKDQLDALRRQLDAANQKTTTIVSQPVYQPMPYHPWFPWYWR